MQRTSARLTILLAIVVVLALASLGGLVTIYGAAQQSQRNTEILKCQADADQQFRRDITELLEAGRDRTKVLPVMRRMKIEARTNYAELDNGRCPKPLTKETP